MLNTLLKIGKWQKEKSNEWSRHLDNSKVQNKDRKGNEIKNYIVPLVFDLDKKTIYLSDDISEYQEKHKLEYKLLRVQGGHAKSYYPSIVPKKINSLQKTFFGDINNKNGKSEVLTLVLKEYDYLFDVSFKKLLTDINSLKENIESNCLENLINNLKLNKNENVVFVYACIKSKEFNIKEITPLSQNDEYVKLLKYKLGIENKKKSGNKGKMCYASGKHDIDVDVIALTDRVSINKMFVTTTQNYLNDFAKVNFIKNYGVSKNNQELLDIASKYFLNYSKIKIANIDHIIIPEFLTVDNIDFDIALVNLNKKNDILFSLREFSDSIENIRIETDNVSWINYYAYETDGNYFKTTNLIKDVSEFHFNKVLNAFYEVDKSFRYTYKFINWNTVLTENGNNNIFFNLDSVYKIIPIRKEKRNITLNLFKMILENRKIDINILYGYFSELALCYYYQRFKSYTNITPSDKDYFYKDIRNSVFKYLAFIKVLKNLNLINMEDNFETKTNEDSNGNKYETAINNLFTTFNYTNDQKALFYLGRMLNSVNYIQKDKNKTVIDKVNYNGMEKDDIVRLRIGLIEKAKQYGKVNYVVFDDAKFAKFFNYNDWSLDSKEALFFILTGFSFGATSKEENNKDNN